jgi:uncharacterized membrane protein YeaQ/YmgE (transglycosylase-associated protein family)
LWVGLAVPPVQRALQSTMSLHMLVQIPLLALAGWLAARVVPRRIVDAIAAWNLGGISGLLLASLAGTVWMVPRALDAALDDPAVALAKFLTVPLLIGAPLALSWPRMGFVVRGVFWVELIATAFRLGWLYLVSPERLCSNYLLSDQQQLGRLLLAIGGAMALLVAWQLIWGRIEVGRLDDL